MLRRWPCRWRSRSAVPARRRARCRNRSRRRRQMQRARQSLARRGDRGSDKPEELSPRDAPRRRRIHRLLRSIAARQGSLLKLDALTNLRQNCGKRKHNPRFVGQPAMSTLRWRAGKNAAISSAEVSSSQREARSRLYVVATRSQSLRIRSAPSPIAAADLCGRGYPRTRKLYRYRHLRAVLPIRALAAEAHRSILEALSADRAVALVSDAEPAFVRSGGVLSQAWRTVIGRPVPGGQFVMAA